MFFVNQINKSKMDAVEEICKMINPEISIKKKGIYTDEILSGYLLFVPDSIKVRRAILETNLGNPNILGVFEGPYAFNRCSTLCK